MNFEDVVVAFIYSKFLVPNKLSYQAENIYVDLAKEYREKMIEASAEQDEELMMKYISHGQDDTRLFAGELIKKLPLGSVVVLTGDLGAGKTTFVQGVASALGIKEKVASPTFNIMKLYFGEISLIHIDAYRLENMDHNIGLDEYIGYEKGYTFIEWPMYIPELIPDNAIEVNITNLGDDEREIVVKGL